MDRVSIRLQVAIAGLDLATHLISCFTFDVAHGGACAAVGFVWSLVKHMYLCLNISIALNMHLLVLLRLNPTRRWELGYHCGSVGLPLALNTPLLGNFHVTC